ncbi:unnamed protein product [Notodromas monacha]|uniref:Uncharacterized protein n=1 Tax=Notodromas monacha TaxID=399045 RepID=A0A7R9BG43_9CRUS|nr:unnamed protein product [Notodromas monacha]CAG0914831.1 unnamed protein product [Notodromas monacha]
MRHLTNCRTYVEFEETVSLDDFMVKAPRKNPPVQTDGKLHGILRNKTDKAKVNACVQVKLRDPSKHRTRRRSHKVHSGRAYVLQKQICEDQNAPLRKASKDYAHPTRTYSVVPVYVKYDFGQKKKSFHQPKLRDNNTQTSLRENRGTRFKSILKNKAPDELCDENILIPYSTPNRKQSTEYVKAVQETVEQHIKATNPGDYQIILNHNSICRAMHLQLALEIMSNYAQQPAIGNIYKLAKLYCALLNLKPSPNAEAKNMNTLFLDEGMDNLAKHPRDFRELKGRIHKVTNIEKPENPTAFPKATSVKERIRRMEHRIPWGNTGGQGDVTPEGNSCCRREDPIANRASAIESQMFLTVAPKESCAKIRYTRPKRCRKLVPGDPVSGGQLERYY